MFFFVHLGLLCKRDMRISHFGNNKEITKIRHLSQENDVISHIIDQSKFGYPCEFVMAALFPTLEMRLTIKLREHSVVNKVIMQGKLIAVTYTLRTY